MDGSSRITPYGTPQIDSRLPEIMLRPQVLGSRLEKGALRLE
jgi:hypothetical protein